MKLCCSCVHDITTEDYTGLFSLFTTHEDWDRVTDILKEWSTNSWELIHEHRFDVCDLCSPTSPVRDWVHDYRNPARGRLNGDLVDLTERTVGNPTV